MLERAWMKGESAARLAPVAVAIATLCFFSVGELFRFFLGLVAIVGLVVLVMERRQPRGAWFRWYVALFACIWLPIAFSAADAESMSTTLTVAARYLIYLLAGYWWITRFTDVGKPRPLLAGAFAILLFWCLDGVLQLATGVNILGNEPLDQQRLTGMLGPRLGYVLAFLSPLFFHAVRTFGERVPMLWLTLVPYILVILYGGSRVSWMLLAVSVLMYTGLLLVMRVRVNGGKVALRLVLVGAVCVVAILQTDWLKDRVTVLAGLASDDYDTVNIAVTDRLPHWQAAVRMFQANPVNGIGAKGYRDAYFRYSDGDTTTRSQPHLFLLEVAAETGAIGLIGYGAFFALILSRLWRLLKERRFDAVPWGFALLLAAFPLSATLSFYAHYMSAMVWFLAMIFVGVAAYEERSKGVRSDLQPDGL
jgi:O-antigen ligase